MANSTCNLHEPNSCLLCKYPPPRTDSSGGTLATCRRVTAAVDEAYAVKAGEIGEERIRWFEKQVLLQLLDKEWREHLQQLDQLRSVIHLRSYGQRDPLNEFKSEAFALFSDLISNLRKTVTGTLMNIQVQQGPPPQQQRQPAPAPTQV